VKQIPVNARTEVSRAQIAASRGPTGESHEVYEFCNHPFELYISELYGTLSEERERSKKLSEGISSLSTKRRKRRQGKEIRRDKRGGKKGRE
jgi:hypothetical protein